MKANEGVRNTTNVFSAETSD